MSGRGCTGTSSLSGRPKGCLWRPAMSADERGLPAGSRLAEVLDAQVTDDLAAVLGAQVPNDLEAKIGAGEVVIPRVQPAVPDRGRARDLFERLAVLPEGDEERLRIRGELVELHLPLVEYLARRFRNRGEW